jgi:hypothetical protein
LGYGSALAHRQLRAKANVLVSLRHCEQSFRTSHALGASK